MTKNELARVVSSTSGLTIKQAKEAVSATFAAISVAVADGETTNIAGFGTFKVKATNARSARNPQTGALIEIPAGKKVVFQPAPSLKEAAVTGQVG